jgi:hypothetical protein
MQTPFHAARARRHAGWVGLKTLVAGLGGKSKTDDSIPEGVDDHKSFSIVFTSNSAIHLELPPGGNGRSRDEWVAAFEDLADGLYKQLVEES